MIMPRLEENEDLNKIFSITNKFYVNMENQELFDRLINSVQKK